MKTLIQYIKENISKEEWKEIIKKAKEKLEQIKFPIKADFHGEEVIVLGPADDFEPYKSVSKGKRDFTQLMVQIKDGEKVIMMANQLKVNGEPLLPKLPAHLIPSNNNFFQIFKNSGQ